MPCSLESHKREANTSAQTLIAPGGSGAVPLGLRCIMASPKLNMGLELHSRHVLIQVLSPLRGGCENTSCHSASWTVVYACDAAAI